MLRSLVLVVIVVLASLAGGPGARARPSDASGWTRLERNDHDLCARAIGRARGGMPKGLLMAVALTESGRWDAARGRLAPWPWSVNAAGEGRQLASRAEAEAWVAEVQARGTRSVDVGCMQINLLHHPTAFRDLDEAFDPEANVAYAVEFLQSLYAQTGSWSGAVARYHSADPGRGGAYRERVMARLRDAETIGLEPATAGFERAGLFRRAAGTLRSARGLANPPLRTAGRSARPPVRLPRSPTPPAGETRPAATSGFPAAVPESSSLTFFKVVRGPPSARLVQTRAPVSEHPGLKRKPSRAVAPQLADGDGTDEVAESEDAAPDEASPRATDGRLLPLAEPARGWAMPPRKASAADRRAVASARRPGTGAIPLAPGGSLFAASARAVAVVPPIR